MISKTKLKKAEEILKAYGFAFIQDESWIQSRSKHLWAFRYIAREGKFYAVTVAEVTKMLIIEVLESRKVYRFSI